MVRASTLIPPEAQSLLLAALLVGLVASVLAGLALGSVGVPIGDVWATIWHHVTGADVGTIDRATDTIVWTFRTPRALLAAVVGAGLAVAGAILQGVVRNPLADPYILGVSEGGAFGAVLAIAVGTAAVGRIALSLSAFAGAMLAMGVVLILGRRGGRIVPTRLVLAGVALGYLFSAGTAFLQLRIANGQSLAGVIFWLLGTVAAASWDDLGIPTVVVLASSVWLVLKARALNALLLGEDAATSLGEDVGRLRLQLLAVASLLTAVVVAVAGVIGFVGLMIPHVARMLVGPDHRRMLPVTILLGAVFLELVDIAARTVASPLELPLSVITAAIGAPFFLWLLWRSDRAVGVA
ncbi:MAG: iron ABC transporter permease [Chloroflexota bacterium]